MPDARGRRARRRGLLVALVISLGMSLTLAGSAEAAQLKAAPVAAVVTEAGRYTLRETRLQDPARDTTAGFNSVIDAELVAEGARVPLRLGEVFGFRFAISDARQDAEWIPVEIRIRHPLLTDHQGQPRRGFVMQSAARLADDGQYHNAAWYLLNQPHELAAGEWEIAVVYQGRVLAVRTFELRPEGETADQLHAHREAAPPF